jgi:hypothetical protein
MKRLHSGENRRMHWVDEIRNAEQIGDISKEFWSEQHAAQDSCFRLRI